MKQRITRDPSWNIILTKSTSRIRFEYKVL